MRRPPAPARLPRALALLVVLAVLTALGVGALASPAEATRRTVSDSRHDVLKQTGQQAPERAPQNASADLVRFTTSMGRRTLVLSSTVRSLPRNYWAMLWRVRTDAGVEHTVDLLKTGEVRLTLSQAGTPVACEGLRKKVERRRDRVVVAVPLRCLGSPTSVQTGAGSAATERDFGRIFTDDALRGGRFTQGDLRLGRPVKRDGKGRR